MTHVELADLRRFVELLGERLRGDWTLVGGCVPPLLGCSARPTQDIDVVGPPDADQSQTLELLRIAVELGLPAEAINQAAAVHLYAVPGWRDRLRLLRRGSSAAVFLPSTELFVELKAARLTAADLDDCVAVLRAARQGGETVEVGALSAVVASELAACAEPARADRLRRLLHAVEHV